MFLTHANLEDDPEPDIWVVMSPLIWVDPTFGRLVVPAGFRTDMASIPRLLRNIPFLDPDGPSRRPAIAHDWLYAWRGWGKDKADEFLRAALLAEGAYAATAAAYYYGVHWGGIGAWEADAGALESRDFDTPAHYTAWSSSAQPVALVSAASKTP